MKYKEVMDYLSDLIERDEIKAGDKLPSIRELVSKFNYNKATIIRAYKELENNHIVYAIPQSGYYLVDQGKNNQNFSRSKIDFTNTIPDNKYLPYQEFSHCMNRAIDLYRHDLFTYGNVAGLEVLRESLSEYFWDQQISIDKDNIYITAGTQQALSIITSIDFPNKREGVLVEQPSYSAMLRLLKLTKSQTYYINRDFNGIDLVKLESIFKTEKIKFFYTIPRFHNPLGTSLSEKEKEKIVSLASQYNVYLVEDDYLSDLAGTNKSLPLYYYDTNDMVIYIKSFSKSFMPGIRIGAVLLPEKIKESFHNHKQFRDLNTSILAQGGLNIYLTSGMYYNHLEKTMAEYQRRMNYAKSILKNVDKKYIKTSLPDTGIFIYLKLNEAVNMKVLTKRLREKNIIIEDSDRFYHNKDNVKELRICISQLSKEEIIYGINTLIDEIKRFSES
jgi:DNA-binding transcriptional MocR family regulator